MGQPMNTGGAPQQPGMNFEGMGGQQARLHLPAPPLHNNLACVLLALTGCVAHTVQYYSAATNPQLRPK